MKKLIVLFATITIAAQAAEEFREFTANDGRKLKAKVVSYDPGTEKVKVLREDGQAVTVKSVAFSREDQAYIREWGACSLFTEPSHLIIIPRRATVRKWRSKHESMRRQGGVGMSSGQGPDGGGGGGNRGGQGGGDGSEIVATDKYTKYQYDLSFANRCGIPLKDLSVEYRIYYNQERPVAEEIPFQESNNQRQGPGGGQQQGSFVAKPEVKVKRGTLPLRRLETRERRSVSTVAITLLERNGSGQGNMIDLDGELHGVWIKVSMKAPDGTWRVRNIAYPQSIMKEYRWDAESEGASNAAGQQDRRQRSPRSRQK
ncbi:MAG: hypothetical protein K9M45_05890 [Kiritimatiellales bacterium]|nr:hypothetical protein [Kiritimatiellales bacterium]